MSIGLNLKITPKTKYIILHQGEHAKLSKIAIKNSFDKIGKLIVLLSTLGIKNPPKTGIAYRYNGRVHIASRVGEYPANRSGNLKDNIDSIRKGEKLYINANAEYAKFLEDGTKKMRKRQFLIRTIMDTSAIQLMIIENELDKELNK